MIESYQKENLAKETPIESEQFSVSSCIELLHKFEKQEQSFSGEKLIFEDVGYKDVYNISAPFESNGHRYIIGRVEEREAIAMSHIAFFQEDNGVWKPVEGAPVLPLEDGFVQKINNELLIGGVEVYSLPTQDNIHAIGYRTVFYKGDSILTLKRFTDGPDRMKDIRLVSLPSGEIGVFTRPQGGENGKGKIGFLKVPNIDNLNKEKILDASIFENQFLSQEWGGANELHMLENDTIGVLGHIAYQDELNHKHYYAMSFTYNLNTRETSPIKIIATRRNFPSGEAKSPELEDIIFPGGLVRHSDGTATLYAGLSDAEAGSIIIPDPFI